MQFTYIIIIVAINLFIKVFIYCQIIERVPFVEEVLCVFVSKRPHSSNGSPCSAAYCFWLGLKYFITDFKWLLCFHGHRLWNPLCLPRRSLVLVSCLRGSRVWLGVLLVPVIHPGTCLFPVEGRHPRSAALSLLGLGLKTH